MAVKKSNPPPLNPQEQERLQELIPEFIDQCHNVRSSRLEAGKLASQLKPLYCRAGRKGGWRRFVEEECGQKLRTVDEWILDYKRSIGIRQAPEPKTLRGNVADSATFQNDTPAVVVNDKPDANGRVSVGAVFVLDEQQKAPFLEAIQRLSPAEATRLMFEALVSAPKDGQP